ncbi:universal stress protein [Rhizobium alvei]|uniref:Universal stress protein n=1 Tax=Rhizobium alvei TaxID=1132659 RepID=A0ABT8YHH1_9HYPH|nr:universal stress protein [Rhizobium alvei]MDO6963125.1 universal stress protein [Rhizobium alvei]
MTIKTIGAVLSDVGTAKAVLDTAFSLASAHEAHVIGLYAEVVDPPPVVSPFDLPDSTVISALYEAAATKRKEIEALFGDVGNRAGGSNEWRSFRGSSGIAVQGLVESARCVDLIVASQPAEGAVGGFDDVLFEGARPVLFIPWIERSFKPFKRILVAWDGSREASRAVFDSIGLLAKAEEVEIFSVDSKDTRLQSAATAGSEIAAVLSRHGLKVNVRSEESAGLPTSAVIENRCSDFSADLLVMGAYSHSRLRERIFGGVTQVLLQSMTVPVLMSR